MGAFGVLVVLLSGMRRHVPSAARSPQPAARSPLLLGRTPAAAVGRGVVAVAARARVAEPASAVAGEVHEHVWWIAGFFLLALLAMASNKDSTPIAILESFTK